MLSVGDFEVLVGFPVLVDAEILAWYSPGRESRKCLYFSLVTEVLIKSLRFMYCGQSLWRSPSVYVCVAVSHS